jgi:hypothetical protein
VVNFTPFASALTRCPFFLGAIFQHLLHVGSAPLDEQQTEIMSNFFFSHYSCTLRNALTPALFYVDVGIWRRTGHVCDVGTVAFVTHSALPLAAMLFQDVSSSFGCDSDACSIIYELVRFARLVELVFRHMRLGDALVRETVVVRLAKTRWYGTGFAVVQRHPISSDLRG